MFKKIKNRIVKYVVATACRKITNLIVVREGIFNKAKRWGLVLGTLEQVKLREVFVLEFRLNVYIVIAQFFILAGNLVSGGFNLYWGPC